MSFFIKNPKDPGFVSWHQDAPLGGISVRGRIMTAWLALSPSIIENGCMKVIAGSHTRILEHVPCAGNNMLANSQELKIDVDESSGTPIILEPGQFSFHHDMIIHGSGPNTSNIRRIGAAIRYTTPFPRDEGKVPETATLVRGTDRFGTFMPERAPTRDMDSEALSYRDDLVNRARKAKGISTF